MDANLNQDSQGVKFAAVQMVSGTVVADNLARAREWVAEAAAQGAQWVVLPEYFALMGQHDGDKVAVREVFGQGPMQETLAELAQQHGIYLVGGTIPLDAGVPDKVWNSCLVFDPSGQCVSRYDKIHLFGFSGLGERYAEADSIVAGHTRTVVEAPFGRVGLSVCYDLRFPELFRGMGELAAIVLPAAFTATTGEAHWEPLLRSRAIENQCYVIASAQGGLHQNGRRTHGHSMIIDPWGRIVAELPTGEGVVCADLSMTLTESIRTRLPALRHRVFKES